MLLGPWLCLATACASSPLDAAGQQPASGTEQGVLRDAAGSDAVASDAAASDAPSASAERAPGPAPDAVPLTLDAAALAAMPWPESAPPLVKAVVAGPWVPGPAGLAEAWFDESMRTVPRGLKAGRRSWAGLMCHGERLLLDTRFNDIRGPQAVCAFALLSYTLDVTPSDEPHPAVVHLEHRGQVRLLIDGRVVLDVPASPDGSLQRVRTIVQLQGNDDAFLLKCARGSPELGTSMDVQLRVTDLAGQALPGQHWQTVRIRDS